MRLEVDELELATIKAALDHFNESRASEDEGRLPRFTWWQHVDENIGALTGEEIEALLRRLETEPKQAAQFVRDATVTARMRVHSARSEIAYFERRLHLAHHWQSLGAQRRIACNIRIERENLHSALRDIAAIRKAR